MLYIGLIAASSGLAGAAGGAAPRAADPPITLSFRDTPLSEVYEMLSRQGQVNILLGKGVAGSVSVNLFEVTLEQAVRSIAEAAGYVVENRDGAFFVLDRKEAGRDHVNGNTFIRAFKVQYTDPGVVAELLTKHLSRYGKITQLAQRRLLVVEELPGFMQRIEKLLAEIDVQPRQILIEAKILEITLDAGDTFGIDWSRAFRAEGGDGLFGTQGLAPRAISGLFLRLVTPDLEIFLDALSSKGRVRTLSTPKLLVLEDQQAEVVIGDRLGFKVTTTINQVTSETVEFLESGVILKVKANVDQSGRILLEIHPEVSTGSITDGIPSQTTTEVTTRLLAADGEKIFIGGLIRTQDTDRRSGVPVLSGIPVLGSLFSVTEEVSRSTETVVMITPHVITAERSELAAAAAKVERVESALSLRTSEILRTLPSAPPAPPAGAEDTPAPRAYAVVEEEWAEDEAGTWSR